MSLSQTSAAVSVGLGVNALRPVVSTASATLNIGSIDISFHGSAWDWLIDLIKGYLESSIKDALDKQFGVSGTARSPAGRE